MCLPINERNELLSFTSGASSVPKTDPKHVLLKRVNEIEETNQKLLLEIIEFRENTQNVIEIIEHELKKSQNYPNSGDSIKFALATITVVGLLTYHYFVKEPIPVMDFLLDIL